MKELVVISGKGGTGKTSVVASLAALAQDKVLADCDVDAADLHLVLSPEIQHREEFRSGHEAVIRQENCIRCGACLAHCQFDAVIRVSAADALAMAGARSCDDCDACVRSCPVKVSDAVRAMQEAGGGAGEGAFHIVPFSCEGCGVCVQFCPVKAIDFPERVCGEWFISDTRHGPMVHAKLGIAAENSGKLVTLVRNQARQLAEANGLDLVIADGAPGIGCPVIASIAGATLVLIVTEPTLSGLHDAERVIAVAKHFGTQAALCVNKHDINPAITGRIEAKAADDGVPVMGRIAYDQAVTKAQIRGLSVVEADDGPAARDIRNVWDRVRATLEQGER